jgi:proline dehydrogenase
VTQQSIHPDFKLSFDNTEIAFQAKTNNDLKRSYWLFKAIGYNWLVSMAPTLVNTSFKLRLPIKGIVRATVFRQFCGGESMDTCDQTIQALHTYGIGSILDYSVEGKEEEAEFEYTANEIIATIEKAKTDKRIPFCVFKVTGVARFGLLNKVSNRDSLTSEEQSELDKVKLRIEHICEKAFQHSVRIFIDAEESWIQEAIDGLAREMMLKYNKNTAIVFNTAQMYRHDRLDFLKQSYEDSLKHNYYLGMKLVRGAYMEKERERAIQLGYENPIQPDKEATDRDYNEGLKFCTDKLDRISLCAGTHNEASSMLLVKLMKERGVANNDSRIYFSQLFGMSDHISYNLSYAGFNVAKYLPYGPVQAVMPYLLRRAQENTSVKGQSGRELTLITSELKRRSLL